MNDRSNRKGYGHVVYFFILSGQWLTWNFAKGKVFHLRSVMNTDGKNYRESDDIDLLSLIERSILFFRKNAWIFIAAVIAGLALGIAGYLKYPVFYQSRLIAHSSVLTNQENIQMVDTWNSLLKKGEYSELAQDFNCSESLLRKLRKIEGTEIQKVFAATNPNGFYIDVQVTDNSILDSLQKGIVYGFESGEYIGKRIAFRRARLKEIVDKLKIEITGLDSTKTELGKLISGKEKTSSNIIVDAPGISRQLIDLNEKLLYSEEDLNFAGGIQVLQSFSKYSKPAGANMIVFIGLGLILTLSIAYILTLFIAVNQRLKARSGTLKNRISS